MSSGIEISNSSPSWRCYDGYLTAYWGVTFLRESGSRCQYRAHQDTSDDKSIRVTEVFVLAQRFDHLTFDHDDAVILRGATDESGKFVTMDRGSHLLP
jgi:hypothetical protein